MKAQVRLLFVSNKKGVHKGVSDAQGPNGETFHIPKPNGKLLADLPHQLLFCLTPLQYYEGDNYPNGNTACTPTRQAEMIKLYIDGLADDASLLRDCNEDDFSRKAQDK